MKGAQRILAFHLLNDKSGSPKVLRQLLTDWTKFNDVEIHLFSSFNENGFLTDIKGVHFHRTWYRFASNPWLRLVFYSWSQLMLMIKLLFILRKSDIVYINTVLPFGAAIAAKLKSCRVIYHIHEVSIRPKVLKWFLLYVVRNTANEIIYVSKYVKNTHNITNVESHVVYNAIEESFLESVTAKEQKSELTNVLMVCSLKKYKGVLEFLALANSHSKYHFKLVLNAQESEIKNFFHGIALPNNLTILPVQKNLHPFYHWADVILNLSRPDEWIETFGLTIIEGMAYALPAIVPPVGGILEVIENGVTGFAIDSRDTNLLNKKLEYILEDLDVYKMMSQNAKSRLEIFREKNMLSQVEKIIFGA